MNSSERDSKICSLYKAGVSGTQIAEKLKIGQGTVYKVLKNNSLKHPRSRFTPPNALTIEEYKEKISDNKKVRYSSGFINSSTKCLHECLFCGKVGLKRPDKVLRGEGLRCCSMRDYAQKVQKTASKKYDLEIAKYGKAVRLDPYLGAHKKIKHLCLIHGEIHETRPTNVLQGHGLVCCMHNGYDDIDSIIKDTKGINHKSSEFYTYELANFPGFLKLGIDSRNRRNEDLEYGEKVLSIRGNRLSMWFLEQAMLHETKRFKDCPKELEDSQWIGRSEVRRIETVDIFNISKLLHHELLDRGPWDFAAQFVPMTRQQREVCLSYSLLSVQQSSNCQNYGVAA